MPAVEQRGDGYVARLRGREYYSRTGIVWHRKSDASEAPLLVSLWLYWAVRHEVRAEEQAARERMRRRVYEEGD